MYDFTTLDTAREEHRRAIALLDATDVDDNYVRIKDVGEKLITPDSLCITYNILPQK